MKADSHPDRPGRKIDKEGNRPAKRSDLGTSQLAGTKGASAPKFPIVAIGASAGGLDAAAKLFDAIPDDPGMAFILVQHLDPNHESQMAELLGTHTRMRIRQAEEGMPIEQGEVYLCPPGRYLGIRFGVLHLSLPHNGNHARLPIDFLIRSLSDECGSRTVCVILSGTGSDGSGALAELKKSGGHIVVQEPEEAEYDGMPRSAILTDLVDAVAPLARIPSELASIARQIGTTTPTSTDVVQKDNLAEIQAIIALLQEKTGQDFSAYKRGTLERRIQRRIGLCGLPTNAFERYREELAGNVAECNLLADDLLINVTSFFRDPSVFERLEREVLPDLIRDHATDQALRVWVVGCSTGEEAYSLAMICRDAIMASRRDIKLQVFASDIDPQAIATAREGAYPLSIKDEIPPDRLTRYFVQEDDSYRVMPGLRGSLVFTVHDVIHDPPFSRMDLISCRNLLIYLKPEAQAKVVSLFHFGLREKGILLLGLAETPGSAGDKFEVLHKAERIYQHVAQVRVGEPGFPLSFVESIPRLSVQESRQQLSRQATFADLCRDLVIDNFAPASLLINSQRQCIYSIGPIGRYLRVASGPPTLDILEMVPPELRAKLRYAIGRSDKTSPLSQTRVCQTVFEGKPIRFIVHVRFVMSGDEDLHLISFVEQTEADQAEPDAIDDESRARILELERELEIANVELRKAIQSRDALVLEQKAINDEALSVNEEFQSTNEELLTSKEELQSLNEELIALNSQLQETLDRQRTASDDLQNILYSTNVATIFLDRNLCIRFFTPATRTFFNVIPGDLGRPLSDLHSQADDNNLLADARLVLRDQNTLEREVSAESGLWFLRRIFPYRTHDDRVEGVVITFIDITDRRNTAAALEEARRQADRSNRGKSRFLAVASHDLRQPLQSLKLVQELLLQSVEGDKERELVGRFDQLLEAMSVMLDSLLDINQIESGVIDTNICEFPVSNTLSGLKAEFLPLAEAQGLVLRVMPSSAILNSDPRLLEVILRNLLANAFKYTLKGKVLIGCRSSGDSTRIEVWDTGVGIAATELTKIFDEFHQVDNAARERKHGFGLGLTIVRELAHLLGHKIEVRSWPGKGSVFSITVPNGTQQQLPAPAELDAQSPLEIAAAPGCIIAVVEDDPDLLELLDRLLTGAGHIILSALNGQTALAMVGEAVLTPEIVLTDYSLPGGISGLEVLAGIRKQLKEDVPGIILTGDISKEALAEIGRIDGILLNKPVAPSALHAAIRDLAPARPSTQHASAAQSDEQSSPIICVVEENPDWQKAICAVLKQENLSVSGYSSAEAFLADPASARERCLIVDTNLSDMSGIALIEHLRQQGDQVPAILITGGGDIAMAVQAMRSGASDFIERPVSRRELIESIKRATDGVSQGLPQGKRSTETAARMATLTPRQQIVLDMVLAGKASKNIAADLEISQRTVESHRAQIMHKLGVRTIPDLVRVALSAPPSQG